ncbi:MAG: hypothetical protein HYV02_02425 [Deltaproteobacteria bacterium]|nr:hypothetical protein [Deltaproteobacteria bacterium]
MAIDPFLGKVISTAVQVGEETGGVAGQKGPSGHESLFHDVLTQMGGNEDLAATLGIHPHDLNPQGEKFQTISASGFDPLPEYVNIEAQTTSGSEFALDMLQQLNTAHTKMDHMFNKLAYGSDQFSMQELLAMQAHIYMWSQEVELGVKVASEGVSSLRTVLNTQVQ